MKRLAALALLAGLFALNPGTAQDRKTARPPADEAAVVKRHVVRVRHADPAVLVPVLAKHYKGQADISAVPGGVLVSTQPAVAEEVMKLIDQLDQKPRSVEIEILVADVPVKKTADGKEVEVDLGGNPAAKIDALVKAGQATAQRVKLTAVEGHAVTSTTGGSKPFTESTVIAPGGPRGGGGGFGGERGGPGGGGFGGAVQRSVSYHQVGTTVKLTARIGADDTIAVDLSVQETKVRPAEGEEARGPVSMDTNTLATQVSVPAGRSVVAQTIRTEGKTGGTVSVVLVTARVAGATVANRKSE